MKPIKKTGVTSERTQGNSPKRYSNIKRTSDTQKQYKYW